MDEALRGIPAKLALQMLQNQDIKGYVGKRHKIVQMPDGWECLQEEAPEGWVPERLMGGFSAAWQIIPSDGFMVYQMPSQRFGRDLR